MSVDVLTVSSKGQIALPTEMRKRLSIVQGDKLAAYASGDVIMLKPIRIPTDEDFKSLLDEAQEWASSAGYQVTDVNDIIKTVRKRKNK